MRKQPHARDILFWVVTFALLGVLPTGARVSAQTNQGLIEDWRTADYSFSARMLATDQSDNVYVLGDTVVGDYLVVKKFSAGGALLWQSTYDPTPRLRGVWLAVDSGDNPVVLASMITGSSAQPSGWLTLKYDTSGALLWANPLPGSFSDARRVAIDAEDNIYVAGRMWLTHSGGSISLDSVLKKYDPDGATLWTASFDNGNGTAVDEPYSLAISPDGTRIGVAGISGNAFMALMYNANGGLVWSKTNSAAYPANDLAFGPGNVSYFATGTYFSTDPSPYKMAIAKFDAAGLQLSINSYSVGTRTSRVQVDSQGNVVATGLSTAGFYDWMTIKTDANGNVLWSRRFNASEINYETPNMLMLDASDAVYVTGTGGPNPSIGNVSYLKGIVVKYSSDGTPEWAVFDPYAGGKAMGLGAVNTLASLGFGYLVTTHYSQTGLPDLAPNSPSNLNGFVTYSYSNLRYEVRLNFNDNANNEFWVEAERCTGSGCTNFAKVAQSLGENAAGLTDGNIELGVIYRYRAAARGFMGLSGYSNIIELAVQSANPPAAPSNLTAAMSGTWVVLNWHDNSTNEQQFVAERCQGAGCNNFEPVGASDANVTTLPDTNTVAGQSYSYRVRATNVMEGDSGYSNTAIIVVPGGPPAPPLAPSNLTAQALARSQIKLTWTNNSANQDGVKIERCQGALCTNYAQIATVAGTGTTYTNSGLPLNKVFRYRVRAYNSGGNSPYSNTASATTKRQ